MKAFESHFNLARHISYKSNGRFKIGAVVAHRKRVISTGFNKMDKTHPRMAKYHPYRKIHAELDAILGVDASELQGAQIYVYREYKSGNIALSKPCDSCQALLREVGISSVFYSDPNQPNKYGVLQL